MRRDRRFWRASKSGYLLISSNSTCPSGMTVPPVLTPPVKYGLFRTSRLCLVSAAADNRSVSELQSRSSFFSMLSSIAARTPAGFVL